MPEMRSGHSYLLALPRGEGEVDLTSAVNEGSICDPRSAVGSLVGVDVFFFFAGLPYVRVCVARTAPPVAFGDGGGGSLVAITVVVV